MDPERWQQIEDLLQSALERGPGQRTTFLAQACAGDERLLREVESLVASHQRAGRIFETPLSQIAAELLGDDRKVLVTGQMVGPFCIEHVLAAGGMGEVYLANDTRLGRKVALKLLPPHFTINADRVRRFEHEARAASALNHPNIVTIHEIGQTDSLHFIATEFVDGETLRVHIQNTHMTVGEVLDVGAQIASALQAAHEAGIVHRDVKPENIMLRHDAYVKVLDFGLAKLTEHPALAIDTEGSTQTRLKTNPGIVMGTVSYMSPEQARGLPVDERTDVWSLGVVLYEMMIGLVPFEGETATDVILSIVEREPPPLAHYTTTAPAELDRIISKALRKNKEERYQTAKDLALDLKNLKQELEVRAVLDRSIESGGGRTETTTSRSAQIAIGPQTDGRIVDVGMASPTSRIEFLRSEVKHHKQTATLAAVCVTIALAVLGYYSYFAKGEAIDSVAVLPFVNVSNDPSAEYLSDGLSDSIIESLSQLPNLKRVIAMSSVLRYKGKQTDPQAVGRELNVRAVLMGRLTQQGDELFISTELVDVKDNKRLWGGQYNRKLVDVLKLQREIAQEITDKLRLKLTGDEKQRLAKGETDNPEAYQLYLKGRFIRRNRVNSHDAVAYLEQAIKLDPNFGAAYAQLAYAYSTMTFSGALPQQEGLAKLEATVTRGLEIDNTNGDLHANLGLLSRNRQDRPGALRELQRAVELDPNSADAHAFYARSLWSQRRVDEAILRMRRALELDPLSPALCTDLGKILYYAEQREQAVEQYRKALELNPNYFGAHHHLSNYYLGEGKYDEAIAEARKMEKSSASEESPSAYLGYVYGVAGRRAEAQKILNDLEHLSKERHVNPEAFALIYTGLRDKDRAFEYLQKQVEENSTALSFLQVLPEWDSLRSDPRYEDLLRRMNFAP